MLKLFELISKVSIMMKKSSIIALLPIGVFMIIYLTLGIVFEYVMKIPMGFYNVPVVVAFLIALFVGVLQTRGVSLDKKFEIMGQGVGDKNIVTMLIIFLLAGIFVGVVGRGSAESVAYFMLSVTPARFAVIVLFIISAFVSTAMGTSVGTITLITPIAVAVSDASGFSLALCVGTVVGGSMFGDNLSFISDTTIAACNGQGCRMKDKFKTNISIVIPAAVITVIILYILSIGENVPEAIIKEYNLIQIVPYVLVLLSGIVGINVFVTLLIGILSGSLIMLATGSVFFSDLISGMGTGASGMFETSIVAVLVAALGALIKYNGGFEALLNGIRRVFKGKKSGQLGIGILVGLMDIATANNTVAIVMANPIANEIAKDYDIINRKVASILDIFSCIVQGFLPYGAQILVALSVVNTLGHEISSFDIIRNMFYPMLLLVSSLIFIFIIPERKLK